MLSDLEDVVFFLISNGTNIVTFDSQTIQNRDSYYNGPNGGSPDGMLSYIM